MAQLHLMTQRNQPYGSERRCCERCGVMLVSRDDEFWKSNAWIDEERNYKAWPADATESPGEDLAPCDQVVRLEA